MKIREPDRTEERIKQSKWYGNEEVISDVGKLIRCKDCKYGNQHNGRIMCMKNYCDGGDEIHIAEWFCADGEPMDGEVK